MSSVSSEAISSVLPSLSATDVDHILQKLSEIGVESLSDLQHVTESDLVPLLKPVQARKLLSAWSLDVVTSKFIYEITCMIASPLIQCNYILSIYLHSLFA